jgi:hypothetical protein
MAPSISELLTQQFYDWEMRGRGWRVWPTPVELEPPFRPFLGHFVPQQSVHDDGQFDTGLSRFADSFRRLLGKGSEQPKPAIIDDGEEPEPDILDIRKELVELQTTLPAELDIPREAFEQFLVSLSLCRSPVSFELLALSSQISAQFAVHATDQPLVQQQLEAFFPEAVFLPNQTLDSAWKGTEAAIVEFGLGREFMFRLASGKLDPFIGIIGALAGLKADELGLVQVMFQSVRHPWAESTMRAVMDNNGDAFFSNAPELVAEARKKISRPLYAAVVRIAAQSENFDRTWEIARNLAGSFHTFADPLGNELIPLTNDDYPFACHVEDVLYRRSRRSGMLLNADELIGFVHLPGTAVRSARFLRQTKKSKAVPEKFSNRQGILLGNNVHHGRTAEVRIGPNERVRHMHVIGASGTGKSTLLLNSIQQDIENGQGVGVLDPHGDLIEEILGLVSEERIADVVLVDPGDAEYSVGFNILSANSDLEKTLLASDLVSIFQRLSTSWGDQMGSVLQNAILAFLESDKGGTLADMRRFFIDPAYRAGFLKTVRDPDIVFYWQKTFPQLTGNRSIGPVLTRLETFLSPKSIRYMVSQPVNRLDFANILDSGKIFLAKLSQGQIGRENAFLLGSLIVAKFQQTAMSRQSMAHEARRDYWLYIDEFHNFITPSMAEILTGARKYRLGLTLAHQELRQLQRDSEVASAVVSNPYTRVVFRVGDDDARKLGEGFGFFEAKDLQNLGTGEAIARMERSDFDFNLTIPLLRRPEAKQAAENRQHIITGSRKKYGTPRAEIAALLSTNVAKEEMQQETPRASRHQTTASAAESKGVAALPASRETQRGPVPEVAATEHGLTVQAEVPGSVLSELAKAEEKPLGTERLHEALKLTIEAEAGRLDYAVTREAGVPGGPGRADLVLVRGDRSIACEISVTTGAGHEIENIIKCLKGGFGHVALISESARKLGNIREACALAIEAELFSKVGFYSPEDFIALLREWAEAEPEAGRREKAKRRKQEIKLESGNLTEDERRARERALLEQIARAMKRGKSN